MRPLSSSSKPLSFSNQRGLKIFYAVQATGNGHIARAIELLPYLQKYGQVDVLLSGSNSHLHFPLPVKYSSKGISLFYTKNGSLNYFQIAKNIHPILVWKQAKQLPVEQYDVVLNDYESITALSCYLKKIPSLGFGHQASFQSGKTPRPLKKNKLGELVLKKYAPATDYLGLHFEQYDQFIYPPVIKQQILQATPSTQNHITVYLPHYADAVVAKYLLPLKELHFEVFSKEVSTPTSLHNITFIPIQNETFSKSLIHCTGLITGAGFETPAEALFLEKKLLCVPIKGQYEQLCNAKALENFKVTIVDEMDENFPATVQQWLEMREQKPLRLTYSTAQIVEEAIHKALYLRKAYVEEHGKMLKVLPQTTPSTLF